MNPKSPWNRWEEALSPDSRFRSLIGGAMEIPMGTPTSGTLVIQSTSDSSIVVTLHSYNPSFVWSDNSTALAVPVYTPRQMQRLALLDIPNGIIRYYPN